MDTLDTLLSIFASLLTIFGFFFAIDRLPIRLFGARQVGEAPKKQVGHKQNYRDPVRVLYIFILSYALLWGVLVSMASVSDNVLKLYFTITIVGVMNLFIMFQFIRKTALSGLTILHLLVAHFLSALIVAIIIIVFRTAPVDKTYLLITAKAIGRVTLFGSILAYLSKWPALFFGKTLS
jgi:hypothetical protein